MEKKNKIEIALMVVFLVIGVACAVCLIIFANQMFLFGSTSNRVWGIVLLSIGFLVSVGMFAALFTSYRFDKKKPVIKYEEVQDAENEAQPQENTNQQ